ncbi:MAG TPA: PAS domain S-box protein [Thermoanaerobaculia bacterium]|nr:PAS domain S-box protein [Thermoanaerobaculia bacterium]
MSPSEGDREIRALRESERDFRALANSIHQLAWMADGSGSIFWYNDRWYEYTGSTLEEMRGWGWRKVLHPDHVARVVERIRKTFETGEPWEDTFPLRGRTGEYRWFLSRALPLHDDEGRVVRWFGTNTDVTEQRRAVDALRDSEERFRALAENATMSIFVIDEESTIEFANPTAERIFGYSLHELIGRSLDALMPEDQRSRHHAGIRRYLETGRRNITWEGIELPGLTKDGRIVPLEISFGEFVRGGRHYFIGIARDITERKQAAEALRESEESYRLLADMIPQHIWTTDPDGYHSYFSRRWYEYTGATIEETRGEGWLDLLHPDDRERTIARWQHSLRTGETYAIEYRFRRADGKYTWFLGQAMPLRNEVGEIVRWFGTLTDISEHKRIEEERERLLAREQEARAEAERRWDELERVTESRARLMRGFSHDVRNPLGVAVGHLHLIRQTGSLSAKQGESVEKVRRSIAAALDLIEDLLELARAETGEIEIRRGPTDLRGAARDAAEEYRDQAEAEGLALSLELPGELPAIASDRRRVRQILGNLLSNAVKYTERGAVTVRLAVRDGGEAPGPGDWIAVDVSDTGPGISPEQQRLLFQEFRRLDTAGGRRGTGIGLAISQKIAGALGGAITVDSEVGRGSTFTLWLPILAAAAEPPRETKRAAD